MREELPDPFGLDSVTLFRGTRAQCDEYRLVLEATAIPYELVDEGAAWALLSAPTAAERAHGELARYAAERAALAVRERERRGMQARRPFGGAAAGGTGYALVLLLAAYCAGGMAFGADWLVAGALQVPREGAPDWWRAVTALTLHADPGHLAGNLFFGIAGGVLCTRLFGYGIAGFSVLAAGAVANYLEMWIAPAGHQAIGASTAVFASLGILSGYAWRQRLTLRGRWLYRWTPLIGGVSMLAFLGAGNEHVAVLGHLLGFAVGLLLGWAYALADVPRTRRASAQNLAALAAGALVLAAWMAALHAEGALQ